jgi:phage gpG-like protein
MIVELAFEGDVQLKRKLMRIGDRAVNARPAFEAIGQLLFDLEREQFSSEGGRASGGWAALADSTVRSRGSSGPILKSSGALEASLTGRGGDNTFRASDEFLLFGSSVDYAGFHQTGTSRMPQRRPLELTESDRRGVVKILQEFVLGGGEGAGLSASMSATLGV